MSDIERTPAISEWYALALLACRAPDAKVECPECRASAMSVAWNLTDPLTREAAFDAKCSSCGCIESFTIVLPPDIAPFFPPERILLFAKAVNDHSKSITERIFQHVRAMPAAAFTTHPLWSEVCWSATTFRWHPTGEAPPIMGLVFDDADAGKDIFRETERQMNHEDRFEEIRISIIEGPVPGQEHRPGYSVRICADPEALAARATAEDVVVDPSIVPFIGQWNRHYPMPESPPLLPKFKQEFVKHKEFLLAPVTRRKDGQLWVDVELGIIKKRIEFRNLSDITADDPDAAALVLPELIRPPEQ